MTVVALGADHAGFPLKEDLKAWLVAQGHHVVDFGTHSHDSVDYADFAAPVAHAVIGGEAERGLLICGTGTGMAIAANKVQGIRAAMCTDVFLAQMSREHNDANVLTLGARVIKRELAVEILETWLAASFAGGRHAQRLEKVAGLENGAPRAGAAR